VYKVNIHIEEKITLKSVYYRDLFMDALFHAGSGESVEVMAELITNKKVTGSKAKLWLLSFGVVKHATKASLKAVLVSFISSKYAID
jgi:hypothetical protein